MAQLNWERIRERPFSALGAFALASWKLIKYAVVRTLSISSTARWPGLREAMGHILCATLTQWDHTLVMTAPYSSFSKFGAIKTTGFSGFAINTGISLGDADVVVLYCHGGGYAVGHPLQYRAMYQRWQRKAARRGLRLSILALQYPLSTEQSYPAQLEAAVSAYSYLLHMHNVPSEKVCIAGDSAGGNLVAATVLHIKNTARLPQFGSAVLFSPWIDLTLRMIEDHNCLDVDVLINETFMRDFLVPQFTGNSCSATDPRISPVLASELKGLPPQLVIYGELEVMQDEAREWIEKCKRSEVSTTVYVGRGALHAFGVGGLLCGRRLETEVDDILLTFLSKQKGGLSSTT